MTSKRIRGRSIIAFEGSRNKELLSKYLAGVFYRRTVENVLKELPELITKDVVMDKLSRKHELEFKRAYEEYINKDTAFMTRKASNALLKSQFTATYAHELFESAQTPIVIFTDHVDSANAIYHHLGSRARVITGSTSMDERTKVLQEYNDGGVDYVIATIKAFGVGITLTKGHHVIFNDCSFVPADNTQARKRIHRIGQRSVCFEHLIFYGEIDRQITKNLDAKINSAKGLI
jgi:SNF2 family DNA or RNA helicase